MMKLKTYENYIGAGDDLPVEDTGQDQLINGRIKEIVENLLKTKQYVLLLQDTAENIYDLIKNQYPPNKDAFISSLYGKDEMLAELIDNLSEVLSQSYALDEIDEIVGLIKRIDDYTENNMDNLLAKKASIEEEDDYEDEVDEGEEVDIEDDDDDPRWRRQVKVEGEENQLKRKNQVTEAKKSKEIEKFLKKHKKEPEEKKTEKTETGKFKKGEFIYLNGLSGIVAKKFNGKRCEVIKASEDKENCYDLNDPSTPPSEDGSNIKGMPAEYMFKEKPKTIIEVPTRKYRASKKNE
jgi:hypothetical protein